MIAKDLAAGLALAAGQAPLGLWPVTMLALIWVIASLSTTSNIRHAAFRGFIIGSAMFGAAMSWIVEPFLVDIARHGWMAPFALILTAAGGGAFWAIPAALSAWLGGTRSRHILALVVTLGLSEWLRGWIFTGLPWALLGHVWVDTPIAQIAAWLGAWGLSALTLLWAGASAWLLLKNRIAGFVLAAALGAGIWGAGAVRLGTELAADRPLMLRIVQPNINQSEKWDAERSQRNFDRLIAQTSAAGQPDLVIWPETAVPFLINNNEAALEFIAQQAGTSMIMGAQRAEGTRYFNSLVLLDPKGAITDIYDKTHLVPFGEYVPLGDAMARVGVRAFAAQNGFGYTAGPEARVITPPTLPPFQPLVCYEAVFARYLRAPESRAEWLVQITNDAWFGTWTGPYQHLAQARFRAIEAGLPLIRAANTGVSAIIDPLGQVREALPLGVAGRIDGPLPAPLPETFWMRWGSGWLVAIWLVAFAVLAAGRLAIRLDRSDTA